MSKTVAKKIVYDTKITEYKIVKKCVSQINWEYWFCEKTEKEFLSIFIVGFFWEKNRLKKMLSVL